MRLLPDPLAQRQREILIPRFDQFPATAKQLQRSRRTR